MAETASTEPLTMAEENPSLDPAAIERAYRRERARRRAKIEHRQYARNSNARYWVAVAVIALITIVLGLMALREIQTSFGILQ